MQFNLNTQNKLLALLLSEDSHRAQAPLNPIKCVVGQVLLEPHTPIEVLYFPEDAMISLLATGEDGSNVEVGAVSNEGLAGAAALLERNTIPYRAVVQANGIVQRAGLPYVKREFNENSNFRKYVLRYLHLHMAQIAQSGICNSTHSIEQRIARWLLSYKDRTGDSCFPYTHEFLAMLMGTRRETISQRLRRFQKLGWIQNSRQDVRILNVDLLETISCECYRIVKAEFESYHQAFVR